MGETAKNKKNWKLAGVRGRLGPDGVQGQRPCWGVQGGEAPRKILHFNIKNDSFWPLLETKFIKISTVKLIYYVRTVFLPLRTVFLPLIKKISI